MSLPWQALPNVPLILFYFFQSLIKLGQNNWWTHSGLNQLFLLFSNLMGAMPSMPQPYVVLLVRLLYYKYVPTAAALHATL